MSRLLAFAFVLRRDGVEEPFTWYAATPQTATKLAEQWAREHGWTLIGRAL